MNKKGFSKRYCPFEFRNIIQASRPYMFPTKQADYAAPVTTRFDLLCCAMPLLVYNFLYLHSYKYLMVLNELRKLRKRLTLTQLVSACIKLFC